MKELLLIIVSFGVLWFFGRERFANRPYNNLTPLPSPSPRAFSKPILGLSEHEESLQEVKYEDIVYRFSWVTIDDLSRISVGVNENLASDSSQLKERFSCSILTSGAFYSQSERPIGLVTAYGEILSPWQQNQLLNGVLGMTQGSLAIREGEPTSMDWAIQAGPIVVRAAQPVVLSLKKDQHARRVVAGVTRDGKLFLSAITASDSLFKGPLLFDLPEIVQKMTAQIGISLTSAINLDGGTASAYLSDTLSLKELKPIGSYICVK